VELSLEGLHTFSGERFALHLTAYIGTDDIMRTLITRLGSSSVNLRLLGELPLNIAAEQGHLSIVRTLLNSDDIDINARDGHDSTPLFLAIPSGHVEVVRLLQEKGADIDAPNASGLTPLAEAAQEGLLEVVRLLLDQGANIEATCKFRRTPLAWAVISGRHDVVALLLEHGANMHRW
jgi:ankyrin repeat protein